MTLDEALDFWFRRVDFERKTPQSGDLKLRNISVLLDRLDNPQRRFRSLHLAGSKGKGSTSALLDAMLRAQGYRVGLFTSPHLISVEERIQVDRQPISPAELIARLTDIQEASRAPLPGESSPLSESLTFFEIATAMGFLHFALRRVDWAVIEVGLGGRFDATNVVLPQVSIITSISLDHTEILGDTTAKIAFEKAGIIKSGRPTISGVADVAAQLVIEQRSQAMGSRLFQYGRDFSVSYQPAAMGHGRVAIETWRRRLPAFELNLVGVHQAMNAAVAVAALECLRDEEVPVSDAAIEQGAKTVSWPARLEVVSRQPVIVLDCAHNVASAQALRDALIESFPVRGKRVLVFGGSRDKDIAGMLAVLAPEFAEIVFTRFGNNPRAMETEQLIDLTPRGIPCRTHSATDTAAAIALARSLAHSDDLICVTGSVFLAGEVRPLLLQ